MRMRRKRNLEARIAACGPLLIARGSPLRNLKEAALSYRALIDCAAVFGNKNPTEIEIGCGNGAFVLEKARRVPSVNYLAVEVCTNVVITAMEHAAQAGVTNVRFLNVPAEVLECYLPPASVERIYLNFSTPLPEKSREKQRLTAPRFLAIYRSLLKSGGEIVQKTDSRDFFEYSLGTLRAGGFEIVACTYDLHRSEYAEGNIETEYERRFTEQGLPVCMAVARLRPQEEK